MNVIKIIVAGTALALSALAIFVTYDLGIWSGYSPGPALFPVGAAIGCGLLALGVIREASQEDKSSETLDWASRRRVIMTVASLWAFAFLLERIGFAAATILLMSFMLLVVLKKPIVPSVATIVIAVGLMYGIFIVWLGLALPKGPFGI